MRVSSFHVCDGAIISTPPARFTGSVSTSSPTTSITIHPSSIYSVSVDPPPSTSTDTVTAATETIRSWCTRRNILDGATNHHCIVVYIDGIHIVCILCMRRMP